MYKSPVLRRDPVFDSPCQQSEFPADVKLSSYKPHVPPGISHSFANTGSRFFHSLPPGLLLRKRTKTFDKAEDNVVVENFTDSIFGPMHFTLEDVVSISIIRGRDMEVLATTNYAKAFIYFKSLLDFVY
uniref:Uncharacterized protein n=1 Tax=Ditylenchus dipsaci TaxID=166011 RepID=A0A915EN03_9BILA